MEITAINVFQVDLPLREGSYRWSGGKSVTVFDATVVELVTDAGVSGWGEVCPLGPVYLPAYAAGCRTGIAEVAPALLGADPRRIGAINRLMDRTLAGHPYVKSALDMACWDLLGKTGGLPVCTLLGGRFGDSIALYRAISQGTAEEMADRVTRYRAEGYRRFQLKVGGPPHADLARLRAVAGQLQQDDVLIADANTGWLSHQALQVVHGARDLPLYPRAALRQLRRVPDRAPRHRAAVHPRRVDPGSAYPATCRGGRRGGRDQRQDQQVRRSHPRAPDPRRLRGAWASR